MTGIERACANNGVDLLIFCTIHQNSDTIVHQELSSGKVDGVIVLAEPSNPIAGRLAKGSMPAVGVADAHENLTSIIPENEKGIEALVDLLWSQGHREIVFVAPAVDFESMVRRKLAYISAMQARGRQPQIARVDWSDSYDQIRNSITKNGRPTALCCWSDTAAYHLLAFCRAVGWSVPDDISITGYDGFLDGQFPYRRVNTVRIPWSEIAASAVNTLIKMRAGEEVPHELVFGTSLQAGDTVGQAPSRLRLSNQI
jgi:DNA-binding LacI/PurR family transcriptional regulator